jgi:outer membrane lipoprotein-sorting protein
MKHALFTLLAFVSLMPAAQAEDIVIAAEKAPVMKQVQPVERPAEVDQAESYFRQLKTVKARFVQTAPDGSQTRGTFYLNRPGKLRFQYDAPLKDFVVADGLFIYFYDGELGQQTNAPISQTLADFLLRKELRLSGDLKVTRIMRADGLMQMTVVQRSEPGAGSITMGFREKPFFELKKWRVKDSQGAITEVELFDTQAGIKLDSSLFAYHDPKGKGLN